MFCIKCGTQLSDDSNYCNGCGTGLNNQVVIIKGDTTVDNKDNVFDFLKNAKAIEESKYTLKQLIKKIEYSIYKLQQRRSINTKQKATHEYSAYLFFATLFITFGLVFISILVARRDLLGGLLSLVILTGFIVWWQELLISLSIGVGVALLIRIVYAFINASIRKENQKAIYIDQNSEIAEYHKRLPTIQRINEQLNNAYIKANEMEAVRQKLYSTGVLYSKYQNFVSVMTIYEYFEAGRCSSLAGANGAYNLFEQELRQNIIIGKLENIENSLNQIRANQFMLYEAIERSNRTAQLIHEQTVEIANTAKQANENAATSAYYTKMIADNTSISAYVDAFYRMK